MSAINSVVKAAVLIAFMTGASLSSMMVAASEPMLGERLRFFRWLEDYRNVTDTELSGAPLGHLKRLPLTGNDGPYLTLGGDYRLRYEHYSNQFFGLRGDFSTGSVMHRLSVHSDLQFESARVFVQLSTFKEDGQRGGPGPLDEYKLDAQQAFVDWRTSWGTVRAGRQEISLGSGKKTGIREGPNQRRAFDGARITFANPIGGPVDVLYTREVRPDDSAFEDSSSDGSYFFGVYANSLFKVREGVNIDLFYLGIDRDNAVFNQGIGDERRHSVGTRFWKKTGAVQFDYEATYQFGDFASGDISAWGLATATSLQTQSRWMPRYGVRLNLASGDADPDDDELGTYSVLFPNPTYVSEAAIYAPGNGLDIQPFVEVKPYQDLTLFAGYDFQWRLRRGDAVYANPGVPLIENSVSDDRFNAWLFSLVGTWQPSPNFTFKSAFVHNHAGSFVKSAGGKDTNFFLFSVSASF